MSYAKFNLKCRAYNLGWNACFPPWAEGRGSKKKNKHVGVSAARKFLALLKKMKNVKINRPSFSVLEVNYN